MPTPSPLGRRMIAAIAAAALILAACGTGASATADDEVTPTTEASASTGVFDASYVHDISLSFDEADYAALIETYAASGTKEWIEATVVIDGVTYESVGIRLKGNSSLRGLSGIGRGGAPGGTASADSPEELPWLIRLDEYVAGQNHDGLTELVIRSNVTETSLNEAVALDLLELAGLASEDAAAVAFTVNGSDAVLRLAVENPNDEWMEENFDGDGALYKAESTGDYSYRGDDPDAYDEVFDLEAGDDNADLTPLIEFLDFINNADDATFATELPDRLDVDAFATYLALQDLIDNFDDIDGPGNNSYLYHDTETAVFTMVAWDHNLAFGALGGGGFGGSGTAGETPPDFGEQPAGDLPGGLAGEPPGGGGFPGGSGGAGGPAQSNVLVERFLAVPEFSALYEEALVSLEASLYDSGVAADVLASWVDVLDGSGLVDASTVAADAERISAYFES